MLGDPTKYPISYTILYFRKITQYSNTQSFRYKLNSVQTNFTANYNIMT